MTREEFLAAVRSLVGEGAGSLGRGADLLGVSRRYFYAVAVGRKPVPPGYVARLRAVEARSAEAGSWVAFLAPRLQRAVGEALRAGCPEHVALAAVAAWAALRLSGEL